MGRRASPLPLVTLCSVLLAACAGAPSTATNAEPRHLLGNALDTALARSILLKPSDLSAGWARLAEDDYSADSLPTQFCLTDFPGYVAGASADYGFNVDPNGKGLAGQLEVDVKITNSEAEAKKQLDRLRSMDSLTGPATQCFLEGYRGLVARAVGLDSLLPGSQLLPRATPAAALQGLTMKASVPYRLGGDKTMYIDDVRIQKGRIVARLIFVTCCKPFDYATVEGSFVNAVAKRLDSA